MFKARTEFTHADFELYDDEDWDYTEEPIRPLFRVTPDDESHRQFDELDETPVEQIFPRVITVDGVEYTNTGVQWDYPTIPYTQYKNDLYPSKLYEIIDC